MANAYFNIKFLLSIFCCGAFIWLICLATFDLTNMDFRGFLQSWIDSLRAQGLSGTLGNRVTNYTAPYVVVLSGFNSLMPSASSLTIMHATGLGLHIFLACISFLVVRRIGPEIPPWQALAWGTLIPTSLANGPIWGQSDAFFTAFVLLALFGSIEGRWTAALISYAAALSIKLVAIFAAPALLIILIRNGQLKRVIWAPFIFLGVYFILNMPYILEGVAVMEVMSIYVEQSNTYTRLSMWAPNPWFIFATLPLTADFAAQWKGELILFGVVSAFLLGTAVTGWAFFRGKGHLAEIDYLWLLSTSALIFPAILPKMHDRYFFLGDVTLWLLAITERRFLVPAILAQTASLLAYTGVLNFLNDYLPLPVHYSVSLGALLMVTAIGLSFRVAARCGIWQRVVR